MKKLLKSSLLCLAVAATATEAVYGLQGDSRKRKSPEPSQESPAKQKASRPAVEEHKQEEPFVPLCPFVEFYQKFPWWMSTLDSIRTDFADAAQCSEDVRRAAAIKLAYECAKGLAPNLPSIEKMNQDAWCSVLTVLQASAPQELRCLANRLYDIDSSFKNTFIFEASRADKLDILFSLSKTSSFYPVFHDACVAMCKAEAISVLQALPQLQGITIDDYFNHVQVQYLLAVLLLIQFGCKKDGCGLIFQPTDSENPLEKMNIGDCLAYVGSIVKPELRAANEVQRYLPTLFYQLIETFDNFHVFSDDIVCQLKSFKYLLGVFKTELLPTELERLLLHLLGLLHITCKTILQSLFDLLKVGSISSKRCWCDRANCYEFAASPRAIKLLDCRTFMTEFNTSFPPTVATDASKNEFEAVLTTAASGAELYNRLFAMLAPVPQV